MKKQYTHILWDFNGTIYDDIDACMKSTNLLLKQRGLPEIPDREALRRHFGFPMKDYYGILGFDFSVESYESVAEEWLKLYLVNSNSSYLMPGVDGIITKSKDRGYIQSIISACEVNLLNSKLNALDLKDKFTAVGGADNINAHSKNDIALRWRADNPSAAAVMIGDTLHDYEVARLINADCILYAGGFQSRARLETAGCPVIDDFGELSELLP